MSFFDHDLEGTKLEEAPLYKFIKNEEFLNFFGQLKAIFPNIEVDLCRSLFVKYMNSNDKLQMAINQILETEPGLCKIQQISENKKVKQEKIAQPMKKSTYTYVSRKRGLDSLFTEGKSIHFNNAANNSKSTNFKSHKSFKKSTKVFKLEDTIPKIEKKYWKIYIGTLTVKCWCTRSIFSLSSIITNNRLVFSKPTHSEVVYVYHQENSDGPRREIGRLTENIADIFGGLIDAKAVVFESKLLIGSESRLSTGDTFYIQTDCFLSEHLFEDDDSNDSINDELSQLKNLKSDSNIFSGTFLKTLVMKLFKEIGLKGTDSKTIPNTLIDMTKPLNNNGKDDDDSEFDELHKNAKIIEIVDSDDETAKQDVGNDGETLSFNQVKDLYRSTEVNVIQQNIPESFPDNFKLELRPYQRQGLSWMLQREKEYDMIGMNNPDYNVEEKNNVIQQLKSFENTLNPLWKEYKWPTIPQRLTNLEQPSIQDEFYLNVYKGTCSLTKPVFKSSCKGGILADEMGLGKTITTLSLVLSFPKDIHYESICNVDNERIDNYAYKTTLIIVPMALLSQWEKEFLKVVEDSKKFSCFTFYGSDSLGNLRDLLCGPNPPTVVLTTYGMVQSEWSRLNRTDNCYLNSGLFSIKFLRVILDEGHNIRNKATKTAKSIYSLKTDRKWVLTGTPIINRLDDLFSLVHFLNLNPWCHHSLWKHCISDPFETGKDVTFAVELLKSILDPILLRRTKNQKDKNGNYLVVLPPKEVTIEKLSFNKKEAVVYEWLKKKAVNSFNENFKSGMVFKNYSTILTQLLRLRQVCCHIDLIKNGDQESLEDIDSTNNNNKDEETKQQKLSTKVDDEVLSLVETIETNEDQQKLSIEMIKEIKDQIYTQYPDFTNTDCSICTGPINIDTCIITECKHCFCIECLTEHFEFQLKHGKENHETEEDQNKMLQAEEVFCPMCRTQINRNRLFRTVRKSKTSAADMVNIDANVKFLTQKPITSHNSDESRDYFVRPFSPNGQSSKINALLIHLEQIRQEQPGEHIIVFSQFTSFLDIIGTELEKYTGEFEILKFDGRLNLEQRQHVLSKFEKEIPAGEKKICVLLLSLKAGGVGLNLTVASRAFLMDPHWNNAIEFQAIDRIHRVGQRKNVKVIRFIMEGSIEERMLAIQEKKNQLGEALTISDEERRKRKMEELQSLFQE